MLPEATKRRKSKQNRKEASVHVRMTEDQKKTLEMAAEKRGLDLSSWLRFLAVREIDLESKGH